MGVAAIIDLARNASTNVVGHQTDNLQAIAAVVIGGTSLFGGIASIGGTLLGSLIPVMMANGLVIMNVQPFYQLVVVGIILIIAVYLDQRRRVAYELEEEGCCNDGAIDRMRQANRWTDSQRRVSGACGRACRSRRRAVALLVGGGPPAAPVPGAGCRPTGQHRLRRRADRHHLLHRRRVRRQGRGQGLQRRPRTGHGSHNWDINETRSVIDASQATEPAGVGHLADGPGRVDLGHQGIHGKRKPVVTIDAPMSQPVELQNIQSNHYEGGQMAAAAMLKLTGGTGSYLVLHMTPGLPDIGGRADGFRDDDDAGRGEGPRLRLPGH